MLRKIRVMIADALGRGWGGVINVDKGLNVILDTNDRMPSPQEFHLNMVCKLQDFQLITL
jgi:hypothetical protein